MSARAGIVVTGTEALSGRVSDRNGPWLSERLAELGIDVAHILVVGDRPADVLAALRFMAAEGHDLVITSGGLGPTDDDLTAEVVGDFAGREMVLDYEHNLSDPRLDPEAILASNRKQAVIPRGATVLQPVGTAPGLVVPPAEGREGPTVVVLPGPPRELQPLWDAAVQTDAFRTAATRAEDLDQTIADTGTDDFDRAMLDHLGLDVGLFQEEYKARFEPTSAGELQLHNPRLNVGDERSGRRGLRWGTAVAVVVVVPVAALLLAHGKLFPSESGGAGNAALRRGTRTTTTAQRQNTARQRTATAKNRTAAAAATHGTAAAAATHRTAAAAATHRTATAASRSPRRVRLQVLPTAPVWVCLLDAGGRVLIGGRTVLPGEHLATFRSRRFTVSFGNAGAEMKVDGKTLPVADTGPVGYLVTPRGRTVLPGAQRPTCA